MATTINTNAFVRKLLFIATLMGLAILYLVFTFKGLTSKYGMDQAQIGREVARGNNLTTNVIRPLSVYQLQKASKQIDYNNFYDTTHSPLNILVYAVVLKTFGADDFDKYRMGPNQDVYRPDQIIAGTCLFFFIIALFVNYILINKMFDGKIAAVSAIIMLTSSNMWNYTVSGLPQMLMLCIFSIATLLLWKAIVIQEAGKSPLATIILCGFMFGLLALAHWLTLWIFLGFLIFSIIYFKPRGVIGAALIITVIFFIIGPLLFNAKYSDGFMGTALYYIQGKIGIQQDYMFRGFQEPGFDVRGLFFNTFRSALLQLNQVHQHVGGFVLASGFFISLIHPFKRSSIRNFRWAIFGMWVFASIGMALYGVSNSSTETNQLHILFMPLMTAFALALIGILWARLPYGQRDSGISLLPYAIIAFVSAAPICFYLHFTVKNKERSSKTVTGYYPNNTNNALHNAIEPEQVIFSDQPHAVAWYADRAAIWTPYDKTHYQRMIDLTKSLGKEITAMHYSPLRTSLSPDYQKIISQEYEYVVPLVGSNTSQFFLLSKTDPDSQ